jgi:hypothetical protein
MFSSTRIQVKCAVMKPDTVLKGIQFIVDTNGKKKAVILSLEEWGELWEDIYDGLVSYARKDEPMIAWETLKSELNLEDV